MSRLEEILDQAKEKLKEKEKARRQIDETSQKARIMAKQAILLVHRGEKETAEERLKEASEFLGEAKSLLGRYPEFSSFGGVEAAWEEYSEAKVFISLEKQGTFPEPLEVPLESYILGLGDVVGELRRAVLDNLREGRLEEAEERLKRMEEIYDVLISAEEMSILLKELRRKIDIARGGIEATRGDLTLEAGRRRLTESMKDLMEKIGERKNDETER
jgi:translin